LNTDELEVHHVHHLNLSPDGERLKYSIYDDEGKPNLILLCDACHGQASSIEQREQSMIPFEELFKDPTKEFEL
jgi:5-methylcytosine-specific restriction endonuclease McrA